MRYRPKDSLQEIRQFLGCDSEKALELPIDCRRISNLIRVPLRRAYPSVNISNIIQKIFSTTKNGAQSYAAFQVTQ